MVCDTPPCQDAFTHQIWNSYLKEYRRYAPDSMPILETRSEVKVKVTVTQGWYATFCNPKMHAHTKFGIPTSNNIPSKRYAPDTNILKTRSEVNVTVIRKVYQTLRHPKIYPHTKFVVPTSKNKGDMRPTLRGTDGLTEGQCHYNMPPSQISFRGIKNLSLN